MEPGKLLALLSGVPEADRQGPLFDSLLPRVQTLVTLEAGTPTQRQAASEVKAEMRDLQAKVERLNQSALDVAALSGFASSTYRGCLTALEGDAKETFEFTFGVDTYTVINLLDLGVLPEDILDLVVHTEEIYGVDDFWA